MPLALPALRQACAAADRRRSTGSGQGVAAAQAPGGARAERPWAAALAAWRWPGTWRGLLRGDGEAHAAVALWRCSA
eukprot:9770713-Alexandrium_andersonii.AAC.1